MKKFIKSMFNFFGYNVSRSQREIMNVSQSQSFPTNYADVSQEVKDIYQQCANFTLISLERVHAIVSSIDYICANKIPGDIVECGVWKGGAMYAAAKALASRKCCDRKIFLFDVFEVEAMFATANETSYDKSYAGKTIEELVNMGLMKKDNYNYKIEDVKSLLSSSGYPDKNFIFKIGRVESTLPSRDIDQIALLRLDTDWYDSTKHELTHLFPKLVKGGILLIDDYGHWEGCKKAVDEYINENKLKLMLHRTDYTGRSAIKY